MGKVQDFFKLAKKKKADSLGIVSDPEALTTLADACARRFLEENYSKAFETWQAALELLAELN